MTDDTTSAVRKAIVTMRACADGEETLGIHLTGRAAIMRDAADEIERALANATPTPTPTVDAGAVVPATAVQELIDQYRSSANFDRQNGHTDDAAVIDAYADQLEMMLTAHITTPPEAEAGAKLRIIEGANSRMLARALLGLADKLSGLDEYVDDVREAAQRLRRHASATPAPEVGEPGYTCRNCGSSTTMQFIRCDDSECPIPRAALDAGEEGK